jgi:tRNA pseudouridine38/39 synthase
MPGKQEKYHPVLRELKLVDNQKYTSASDDNRGISSADVLHHLLATSGLTPESVESAVKTLQDRKIKKASSAPANHRTRHIALRFFYDGANFNGLAQNLGIDSDNSVEKVLFEALLRAQLIESRETSLYSRCGRTDSGVSAAGQVVAMHLKSAIPPDACFDEEGTKGITNEELPNNEYETIQAWVVPRKRKKKGKQGDEDDGDGQNKKRVEKELTEYAFAKILNNLLPPEIRILGWAPVSNEFSARFSAGSRTYRYFFCRRSMDLDRIRQGLRLLEGKHDFRNFCKMNVEQVYNFERKIHSAELIEQESDQDILYIQIHGQAFLWHQIRCIMELVFMIGKRLEAPEVITELYNVQKYPGKPSYPLAPEKPLVLHNCGYPNLHIGYSAQNVWTVSCQLERQWEELMLAAARIRDVVESLDEVSVLKDDLVSFATAKLEERNKKLRRAGSNHIKDAPIELTLDTQDDGDGDDQESTSRIQWSDALPWLTKYDLVPDAVGLNTSIHTSLLERSKGTTYEEKVEAAQKSDKRRQKFQDNVIKKRKTAEEDRAFYDHKINQGGTGR